VTVGTHIEAPSPGARLLCPTATASAARHDSRRRAFTRAELWDLTLELLRLQRHVAKESAVEHPAGGDL